jgi:hypothetical protein
MNYIVVISLSRRKVRFHYQIENGSVQEYLFDDKSVVLPLAFYLNGDRLLMGQYAVDRAAEHDENAFADYFGLMADADVSFAWDNSRLPAAHLLRVGLEHYFSLFLEKCISSPDSSIDANRTAFPLYLDFANDVSKAEADMVCDMFECSGYSNVAAIGLYNVCLFNTLSNNDRGKLLVFGSGNEMTVSYVPSKSSPAAWSHTVTGVGQDPRYRVCADFIYEQICMNNPGLAINRSSNNEVLMKEARKVLDSGMPIVQGTVRLDLGADFEYQIFMTQLKNRLVQCDDARVTLSEVENLVYNNGRQPAAIDVILQGEVATDYFVDVFKTRFSVVINVTPESERSVWNAVFAQLRMSSGNANGFAPVAAPPVQSTSVASEPMSSVSDTAQSPAVPRNGRVPLPASLAVENLTNEARIRWTNPGTGLLRIYVTDKVFPYSKGDVVDISALTAQALRPVGDSMTVVKDFSGQRFYLPVVEDNGVCCAGNQVSVVSVLPPQGVAMDCSDTSAMLRWDWNGIDGVRIRVKPDSGNQQQYDIFVADHPQNNATYSLPSNTSTVELSVASIIALHDGSLVESSFESKSFSLHKVMVDFVEIRKGGLFAKNKYTIVVRCNEQLPVGLSLYAAEGSFPIGLDRLQPMTTVLPEQVTPGTNYEIVVNYERKSKQELYFRVAAADLSQADKLIISPEFKSIK